MSIIGVLKHTQHSHSMSDVNIITFKMSSPFTPVEKINALSEVTAWLFDFSNRSLCVYSRSTSKQLSRNQKQIPGGHVGRRCGNGHRGKKTPKKLKKENIFLCTHRRRWKGNTHTHQKRRVLALSCLCRCLHIIISVSPGAATVTSRYAQVQLRRLGCIVMRMDRTSDIAKEDKLRCTLHTKKCSAVWPLTKSSHSF